MWNDWTTPQIKVDDYIRSAYSHENDCLKLIWDGGGKLAFLADIYYFSMLKIKTNVFISYPLMLRIVTKSKPYPPFGYIVMRESFEAQCYQYVLLPLLGIVQSIFNRLLWTAVVWDLVYCEMATVPQWRNFRLLRWLRGKIA